MKDNKSEQQSSDEGEHASPSQATLASNCEEDHYLEQYYSLLGLQQREVIIQSQLVRELQAQQISYNPDRFVPEMEIQIQEKTANFQTIQMSVTYGHFNTKVGLINVYSKSPVQVLNESFSGSFGVVYKSTINHYPVAIKTAKIFPNKFQSTFRQIIKEYFLLKIAAALKIGPKIIKNFGFDIAVFKDSFAFGMEFCEMSNYKLNGSFELLRRKLHLLHILGLVHLDLKPENIAFSHAFDQYVFIDFGLSRVVCQPLGSKTLVAFTGSFSYCCPEMLELYLKDQLGYINLYYNDAFCLEKSMKYLSQLEVEVIEEMLFVNRPNFQQLIECEILLKIKLALFESAVYFTTDTEIFLKNQRFIKKKLFELNSYALMLPQSLNFLNLTRKYLKISTNVEDHGSKAKDETIGKESRVFDEAMELFSNRFHMIQNYQDNEHDQQPSSSFCACVFLHDEEKVKDTRLGLYKLAFITYIRLNSYQQDFASKISACRLFSALYMESVEDTSNIQLYKACIHFIFESSLAFTDPEDWMALRRTIETVTILEIVSEDQLLRAFALTLDQPLKFFDKMNIVFEFINSAEYINQKYKTRYNYSRLIVQIMSDLDKYLNSVIGQLKKDEEKEIFMALKHLISKKIPCDSILNYQHFKNRLKDQGVDWKILHQSILYHSICNDFLRHIDIHGHFSDNVFKLILVYLNSTNYYYPRVTYCHFVMHTVTYVCNQTTLNRAIYSLFHQQLKQFQECKHFKAYLLNKLITIKDQQSKDLLSWRYSMLPTFSGQGQEVELQEIFDIYNYIIEEGQQFLPEIGYLLNIANILEKPYLVNIINRLIDRNKEKIFRLSYKLHQDGLFLHNNKLRKEIIAKNNIFEFVGKKRPEYDYDQLASTFMHQCYQLIGKSSCFQCKLLGFLQLKLIQANILVSYNLIQESFLLILDIFVVYIKNTQYFKNAFSILICLLKKWRISNQLYKKYDLQGFLYQFVHENENYQHCLIDIREYNLFLSLYLYIAKLRTDGEMVHFILKIITLLLERKSLSFVNNFYYSIVYMVKINKGNDLWQFKVYHNRIVEKILQIPNLLDYKFIALYFSALLEVKIRTDLQSKMLETISFLINSIDSYTKSIILNRYFYNIAFYILSSKRKQGYLCTKHMKYCQDSFSLKFILRRKMRHWGKCGRHRFTTKMKSYIERYHYNISNVI